MRLLGLLIILVSSTTFVFGQTNKVIISNPNFDDYNAQKYIQNYFSQLEGDLSQKVVIYEGMSAYLIKGFNEGLLFDTTVVYCSEQKNTIRKLFSLSNVKVYGTSVGTDLVNYLQMKDSVLYERLDSLSYSLSKKSFLELFLFKDVDRFDSLYNFIVNNYSFDQVEKLILKRGLSDDLGVNSSTFYSLLFGNISSSNIYWLHDWTWNHKRELFPKFEEINIIPKILNQSVTNERRKINKIRKYYMYQEKKFPEIKYKDLPRKIRLNDFIKRLKKKEIKEDRNIFILGTSSCKMN